MKPTAYLTAAMILLGSIAATAAPKTTIADVDFNFRKYMDGVYLHPSVKIKNNIRTKTMAPRPVLTINATLIEKDTGQPREISLIYEWETEAWIPNRNQIDPAKASADAPSIDYKKLANQTLRTGNPRLHYGECAFNTAPTLDSAIIAIHIDGQLQSTQRL